MAALPAPPFSVVPLDVAHHDRKHFDSGAAALNRYLREQAAQDMRRRVATCFVAVNDDARGDLRPVNARIAGYYTLSTASVPLLDLPDDIRHKLPRYGSVPAVRMGRLAVDTAFQGQGLGAALLSDALKRSAASGIASAIFFVDAKDEDAAAFYRHYGFAAFMDTSLGLFLPLATACSIARGRVG